MGIKSAQKLGFYSPTPLDGLDQPLGQLVDRGFIEWDERVEMGADCRALARRSPENPNQVTSAVRRIVEIPAESPLTSTFKGLAERFCQRLVEGLPKGFGQPIGKPRAQGQPHAPTPERFAQGIVPIPEAPVSNGRTLDPRVCDEGREKAGAVRRQLNALGDQ